MTYASTLAGKLPSIWRPFVFRRRRLYIVIGSVISTLSLNACGVGGLSGASTCQDFMKASGTEQHEVVDQLASHYRKPAYTTPLGEPEVPYYCSANPSTTLEQFFQKAED
jgi:hypothetical protein